MINCCLVEFFIFNKFGYMFKVVLFVVYFNVVVCWKCFGDDIFVVEGFFVIDFKGIDEVSIGVSIRLLRLVVVYFFFDEEYIIM